MTPRRDGSGKGIGFRKIGLFEQKAKESMPCGVDSLALTVRRVDLGGDPGGEGVPSPVAGGFFVFSRYRPLEISLMKSFSRKIF